ncbi:hypothetical protein B4U45_04035 [Mycobacterium persicum]|uniref:Uncharacterized protein n=1 Tax=Mycobacterium persicum TaxID=1487726 RepID=A0A8E2IRC9_9MYCO|nr:hypothetical protein [Mycobacterium persicum]KZS85860.1 hypothetical protein A4G31_03970 [Mycobacterium persicum]ORB93836.1 hypothetical protein B1T44_04015 [Mycobacterium persicum]ORC00571.1 hypothetical protein B1T48_03625 [Mycobacterium persicum]ORC05941.1 hypothetical protein B4U45_04035 [Mycobacterium persicum]VAZ77220.1 hypothetical protein LAUMK15_03692 [Mycobacterium persicum]
MNIMWKHVVAIPFGALAADTTALAHTAEALRIAEQTRDELVLGFARLAHGLMQIHHGGAHHDDGLALPVMARQSAARQRFVSLAIAVIEPEIARHKVRQGDLDGAIELARSAVDDSFAPGEMIWHWLAVTVMPWRAATRPVMTNSWRVFAPGPKRWALNLWLPQALRFIPEAPADTAAGVGVNWCG